MASRLNYNCKCKGLLQQPSSKINHCKNSSVPAQPGQPSIPDEQPQLGQLESPSSQSQPLWPLQATEKQHLPLLPWDTESQIAAQKSNSSFLKAPSTARDVLPRK